jgi:oligopeptide transport system substrate-binding protein
MKRTALFLCAFLTLSAHAGKVFKYSENGVAANFDPTQANTVYDSMILKNIYDTPFTYRYLKRPYELAPQLAESMPKVSKDGLTYTFSILKGVKYADDACFEGGKGREVVAEDFIYGMKRHFDPATRSRNTWLWKDRIVGLDEWGKAGADYSKEIEGLKATDKHTIRIKLKKPYPQLLYTLAMAPAAFVPKEAVTKYGREFGIKPVGSGPYKLESFNTKKAVLARNATYREEKLDLKAEGYDEAVHGKYGLKEADGMNLPITDKVEVHFFDNPMPRWNSFTKGTEIQVAGVPPELLKTVTVSTKPVKLKPDLEAKYHNKVATEFGLVYTNFNMADPRVGHSPDPKQNEKNKALRCAIRKGFNWDERIRKFYYGIGEAFPGIIPPGIDGYDPNVSKESITNDVEGAKKLLADAGWTAKDLPVLEEGGVASTLQQQFFEQFRGWMLKIGYPREKLKQLTYATFGDYSKAMKERKVLLHGLGWAIDYPDSENLFQLFYGPNESPGSNSANYKNPKYDELYAKSSVMQPGSDRTAIYKQMNQMLIDDCVTIAGFSRTGIGLWHKNVVMYPDRDVLGGAFFKYVLVK